MSHGKQPNTLEPVESEKKAPPENTSDIERTSSGPCYIKNLPVELLCEIFRLAEAEYREEHGENIVPSWTCAGRFSRVSKYWRDVVFGTGELWSTIRLEGNNSIGRRALPWLAHSKKSPLNVEIWASHKMGGHTRPFNYVKPHLKRTNSLRINMYRELSPRKLLWPSVPTSLTKLQLEHVNFGCRLVLVNVLRSCPRLEFLKMDSCHFKPTTAAEKKAVISNKFLHALPRLNTLYLEDGDIMIFYFFTQHIKLPALKYFSATIQGARSERPNSMTWSLGHGDLQPINSERLSGEVLLVLTCVPLINELIIKQSLRINEILEWLSTPVQVMNPGEEDQLHFSFPLPWLQRLRIEDSPAPGWNGPVNLMALRPRYEGVQDIDCPLPIVLHQLEVHCRGVVPLDWDDALGMFDKFKTNAGLFVEAFDA